MDDVLQLEFLLNMLNTLFAKAVYFKDQVSMQKLSVLRHDIYYGNFDYKGFLDALKKIDKNLSKNEMDLPKDEIDGILRDMIIPQIIGGVSPQAKKEAFILGGQPGSGKSALVRRILKSNGNAVFINGDDLRSYHPRYYFYLKQNDKEAADLTQPVCNLWIEALIKECAGRNLNVIVEGTMRRKEAPLTTARMLRDASYFVNLVVISAPYELSLLSLEYRYEALKKLGLFARYTKKESHDEVFNRIENTLEELSASSFFDRFYVYERMPEGFREGAFELHQSEHMLQVFKEGRKRVMENREKDFNRFLDSEIKNQGFIMK